MRAIKQSIHDTFGTCTGFAEHTFFQQNGCATSLKYPDTPCNSIYIIYKLTSYNPVIPFLNQPLCCNLLWQTLCIYIKLSTSSCKKTSVVSDIVHRHTCLTFSSTAQQLIWSNTTALYWLNMKLHYSDAPWIHHTQWTQESTAQQYNNTTACIDQLKHFYKHRTQIWSAHRLQTDAKLPKTSYTTIQ